MLIRFEICRTICENMRRTLISALQISFAASLERLSRLPYLLDAAAGANVNVLVY